MQLIRKQSSFTPKTANSTLFANLQEKSGGIEIAC
jgi:hypothetical protein